MFTTRIAQTAASMAPIICIAFLRLPFAVFKTRLLENRCSLSILDEISTRVRTCVANSLARFAAEAARDSTPRIGHNVSPPELQGRRYVAVSPEVKSVLE